MKDKNKIKSKQEMKLTFSIIYGSVRSDRQGIKAAKFLERKLRERDITTHLIDPMEYHLPLLDKMYKEYAKDTAPAVMETLAVCLQVI